MPSCVPVRIKMLWKTHAESYNCVGSRLFQYIDFVRLHDPSACAKRTPSFFWNCLSIRSRTIKARSIYKLLLTLNLQAFYLLHMPQNGKPLLNSASSLFVYMLRVHMSWMAKHIYHNEGTLIHTERRKLSLFKALHSYSFFRAIN